MSWLTSAGRFKVERHPYAYLTGAVDLDMPRKGLLHTTEGATIEGALSVFDKHYAPNFTVGKDAHGKTHILQHAPLGIMGQALVNASGGVETNRWVFAQIEIVGSSKSEPWLPEGETLSALVNLMRTLSRKGAIPPVHPQVKRDPALWRKASGWVGHVDCPENTHVDPGNLRWAKLLDSLFWGV